MVAYALYCEQLEEISLRQLFVVRNRRRQGIGRQAVEILRSQIWPKNKRLTVSVLVQHTAAVAFWRAAGCRDYALTLEILPGAPPRPGPVPPVGEMEFRLDGECYELHGQCSKACFPA
ncbi:MAG: hypothetical protein ACLPRE_09960 [Limisphaerales bacterium]